LSEGFGVSVDFLQRVARGIIKEEDYLMSENKFAVENLFEHENKNISPDLIKQINDFQSFMSIIGHDNKNKSEKEWAELIYELKSVIDKHMKVRA